MKTVLYTRPANGRATYYRAGVAFPDGVAVAVDPAKVGAYAMDRIEADPRLKVSDVAPQAVEVAAERSAPDAPDGGEAAFRARLVTAIGALPADAYRRDGVPRITVLRDALGEADRAFLTADLLDDVWAGMRPAA